MKISDNQLLNVGLHGAIGASAGGHIANVVGQSNTLKAACTGGGTAVGAFLANESVIEAGIAGVIGATGPWISEKVGKQAGTKAAIITLMGAVGGAAAAFVGERFA